MKKDKTGQQSDLWQQLTSTLFSKVDEKFISSFRAPGGANTRLAAWDPYEKSMRHYKLLLFNVARNKSPVFFEAYSMLKNTHIGNPVSVKVNNCVIDVDYLSATEEFLFLSNHLIINDMRNIIEIGAGFGRTCHTFLTLADTIDSYTIIDLPEILILSITFLKQAIPEHYHKIKFVENTDEHEIAKLSADLVINIDSFQEMPVAVIDQYMQNIIFPSKWFYSKNSIGKYLPKTVGLPELTPEQLQDVYSLGYSQNIYDLFDEDELITGRIQHCIDYLSSGWEIIADSPSELFPYFHHILYKNSN